MNGVFSRVRHFLVSEDGPTAVEYAVMLALIVVVCVAVIKSLGTSISSTFSSVQQLAGRLARGRDDRRAVMIGTWAESVPGCEGRRGAPG